MALESHYSPSDGLM